MVVDNKPNSTSAIFTTIERLMTEVQDKKNKLNHDEKWKVDFQNGLTDIQQLVKQLGENLDKEVKARTAENIELEKAILPLSQLPKRFKFVNISLVSLIITIAAGIIVFIITQLIN